MFILPYFFVLVIGDWDLEFEKDISSKKGLMNQTPTSGIAFS
jgi:hypothetical protein